MSAPIEFEVPETVAGLKGSIKPQRKCRFAVGAHNTRLVAKILMFNGIQPTQDDNFTLLWASSPESDTVSLCSPLQRINHFPYSKQLVGNKAELAHIMQNSPHISDFPSFFPLSYVLPTDRDPLFRAMKSRPNSPYIAKPPEGSCGHGIKIVTFEDFYTIHHEAVVSEYIARPLTIDGFKFDLRIYVLVTSFAPLRAFVYKEGLARFATETYSIGKTCRLSQLTNATLNKTGRNWHDDFKWKLSDLLRELEHRFRRSPSEIMAKVYRTVAQTVAIIQPSMIPDRRASPINPFFELYGFDLLLDRELNMWLLEINTNPSMGFEEDVDFSVKGPLLANALTIVGIPDEVGDQLPATAPDVSQAEILRFEEGLVREEDRRNKIAGNGFIRIFPSEEMSDLEEILVIPPYVPHAAQRQRQQKVLNPKKLGNLLTPEQAEELLIAFLGKLATRAKDQGDVAASERVTKFLAAQGYHIANGKSMGIAFRKFAEKLRAANPGKDREMPDAINRIIEGSGDGLIGQLLVNSHVSGMNQLRGLFS
jgi:tubulin polyglutamylase TTLL5